MQSPNISVSHHLVSPPAYSSATIPNYPPFLLQASHEHPSPQGPSHLFSASPWDFLPQTPLLSYLQPGSEVLLAGGTFWGPGIGFWQRQRESETEEGGCERPRNQGTETVRASHIDMETLRDMDTGQSRGQREGLGSSVAGGRMLSKAQVRPDVFLCGESGAGVLLSCHSVEAFYPWFGQLALPPTLPPF